MACEWYDNDCFYRYDATKNKIVKDSEKQLSGDDLFHDLNSVEFILGDAEYDFYYYISGDQSNTCEALERRLGYAVAE